MSFTLTTNHNILLEGLKVKEASFVFNSSFYLIHILTFPTHFNFQLSVLYFIRHKSRIIVLHFIPFYCTCRLLKTSSNCVLLQMSFKFYFRQNKPPSWNGYETVIYKYTFHNIMGEMHENSINNLVVTACRRNGLAKFETFFRLKFCSARSTYI